MCVRERLRTVIDGSDQKWKKKKGETGIRQNWERRVCERGIAHVMVIMHEENF